MPAVVVRELDEADALITLRTYYRNREQTIQEAEQRGMPIYVLRANTRQPDGTGAGRNVQPADRNARTRRPGTRSPTRPRSRLTRC